MIFEDHKRTERGAPILLSKRSTFSILGLAIFTIAIALFAWHQWSNATSDRADRKPIGAWIEKDFNTGETPAIVIFGDSQLGGLRSADAEVANRKLDFALDHRGYAIERELKKVNCATAPSRLDISNALSRLGFANTFVGSSRPSEYGESGLLRSPKVFIASQPGSIASDYYAMSKCLITEKRKPAIAIVTINPRSLLDNGLTCPGDSDYFRYFARRTTFDSAVYNVAFPKLQNKIKFALTNIAPPATYQVEVGQFVFLPDDQQTFTDRLLYPINFSLNEESCRHQIWFLNETLKHYRALKIKTILVSLPLLSKSPSIEALSKLHGQIQSQISEACANNSAEYIDLTNDNRFAESDFLDPVHLSQSGGAKLAGVLTEHIAQ